MTDHRRRVRRARVPLLLVVAVAAGSAGCSGVLSQPRESVFFPPLPQRPRIQYLTKISVARDVEGDQGFLMRFLVGEETVSRKIHKPTGVAVHDGVIYVTDPGWDSVIVVDLKERTFDSLRDRGAAKLRVPVAIAIDDGGNKFIADPGRGQVLHFNDKDEFVGAYGDPEQLRPTGVAVDDHFLYVVNRGQHRVEVIDRRTGKTERTFGKFGKREGRFNVPTSISMDADGDLFVTDMMNFRIQQFGQDGEFIKSFGFLGDGPGTFARPKATSVDRDGHLYTVDAAFENVQVWDTSNAQVVLAFGSSGVGPGDMYIPGAVLVSYELVEYFEDLVDPEFDLEYVILVVNNYGPNKLAVYGFVNPKDLSRFPEVARPDEESEE